MRLRVEGELACARERTLRLLAALSDEEVARTRSPELTPIMRDLTDIADYEERWLFRGGESVASPPAADLRALRGRLDELRERVLEALPRATFGLCDPLLERARVYGMVVQHEHRRVESLLATLAEGTAVIGRSPEVSPRSELEAVDPAEVEIPEGAFVMGTDDVAWANDDERPAHLVRLAAYRIDAAPVTNGDYARFADAGGYEDRRWWTDEGWHWREQHQAAHPLRWVRVDEACWTIVAFGCAQPLPAWQPVQHVSWYEADAYARWAGKRLPTEAEWEKAAAWSPAGQQRRYPWGRSPPTIGHANLGQRRLGPSDTGGYPSGRSAFGCHQMLGDVWEWTSSAFEPYPGFIPFPDPERSRPCFGEAHKVLRGGSWATAAVSARTTARGWAAPAHRHLFAGFRCASDV